MTSARSCPEAIIHRSRTAIAIALTALLSVGATAAPASAATPTTYRIDCTSKQAGDGVAAPWNSLSAVNAHGTFIPGDRILLRKGTTCKGRLHLAGVGSASNRILLSSYGSGARPTINGGGTPNASAAVQVVNPAYWTIQGLKITNRSSANSTTSYRSGLLLTNDSGVALRGVAVKDVLVTQVTSNLSYHGGNPREWGGIIALTTGAAGSRFDDLTISGNTVQKVGRTGVAVINHNFGTTPDRRLRVTGNKLKSTRGDGILVFGSQDARIDHNTVASASELFPCAQCENISRYTANAAVWPAQSTRVRVDHNEVYGTKVSNGDGEAFDIDASAKDVVLEYNYAHDNDGGGVLFCGSINAVARFNIFENNKKSAVAFIGSMPAKNTSIYNNTIYASKATGASVVRTFNGLRGSGISFKNNLIYSYGAGKYIWPTKAKTSANQLIGIHKSGRPADSKTVWRDPGLKKPGSGSVGFRTLGGYKPKHASTFPKGVAIPKSVTRDFFGKKINPLRPPRGAAG